MQCPLCGRLGRIPASPSLITDMIPEIKSNKALFQCRQCGESVNIWGEGAPLHQEFNIMTCPFCGWNKPMRRI